MRGNHTVYRGYSFLLAAGVASLAQAQTFRLTPVPILLGGSFNSAAWVNNAGVVVGESNVQTAPGTGTSRAYRWSEGTAPVDLGAFDTAPQNGSAAASVNDLGQVVGWARGDVMLQEATLFRDGFAGGILALGRLDASRSFARSINETGQMVGYAESSGVPTAFIYENGAMRSLLGRDRTTATGINEFGQISGFYQNFDVQFSPNQAFRARTDGAFTNLGTLGGSTSYGRGINDRGDVVGDSTLTVFSVPSHAFLAPGSGGPMIDLGTLGAADNFDQSVALAINNGGHVVGTSYVDNPGSTVASAHAFIYRGGQMLDLNHLLDESGAGWILGSATSINDAGQIVGNGINPDNGLQAFLLTPWCPADLDDGTLTGTRDGGVDVNDLLYFLQRFEAGDVDLDSDGDPAAATPDGGTDINDLLFFLARFELGC